MTDELDAHLGLVRARLMHAIAVRDQLPAAKDLARRSEVAEAAAAGAAGGSMAALARALGLSSDQVRFLWAAVAVGADPALAMHVEALAGSPARRGLPLSTYAHALAGGAAVVDLALWLAAPNPLTRAGLLTCADATVPPAQRVYAAPARLIAHLRGDDNVVPPVEVVAVPPAPVVDPAQASSLEVLSDVLARPDVVVVLEGPPGAGRRTAVARAYDGRVAAVDIARVEPSALGEALSALAQERALTGALPVIAGVDGLADDALARIGRTLDEHVETVVLTTARPGLEIPTRRPLVRIGWPVPDATTRLALWRRVASPDTPPPELDLLALRYAVGPGPIARAAASARILAAAERPAVAALTAGLRHNIAEQMGGLAHRVEVTQEWEELVLADDIRDQVTTLIARVRHGHDVLERWGYRRKLARGTGVAALFSGPPGTGKTMVAGLVARALELELYQVDLSQIVSKWVGETEKQLARVFDAAEQGHALLLFDEADALFGQRTSEVKGAVDRYANLEVNYLLQRVEAFGGITILTTNLDTSIDRALKRWLAAHIVFDLPDEEERALLWRRLVASEAPIAEDVDYEQLAREFAKMSGANIRNAALAGAFLAAAEGAPAIAMAHLVRAARAEYRSMGHVLAERRGR